MRGKKTIIFQPLFFLSFYQCLLRTYSVSGSGSGAKKYSTQQDIHVLVLEVWIYRGRIACV